MNVKMAEKCRDGLAVACLRFALSIFLPGYPIGQDFESLAFYNKENIFVLFYL